MGWSIATPTQKVYHIKMYNSTIMYSQRQDPVRTRTSKARRLLVKKKRAALIRRRMKQEQKIVSQFENVPISSKNHEKFGMKVQMFTKHI